MKTIAIAAMGAMLALAAPVWAADRAPVAALTDADNNTIRVVKVGDTVTVTLTTASDGGYRWVAAPAPGVVMVGEPEAKRPNLTPPMVGGMGTTVFTFRMTAPGTHVVRLTESRPWEKNAKPVKTFQFTMKTASPVPVRKPRSR